MASGSSGPKKKHLKKENKDIKSKVLFIMNSKKKLMVEYSISCGQKVLNPYISEYALRHFFCLSFC